MSAKNTRGEENAKGKHEHPLRQEISDKDREIAESAREEAMEDIEQDPDNIQSPNDDLDEGESARLGEDTSAII